jgi:hypothetical protein
MFTFQRMLHRLALDFTDVQLDVPSQRKEVGRSSQAHYTLLSS